MSTGSRRFPVEIQDDTGETRTGRGSLVAEWETVYECFADLVPLSGREYWEGQQTQADADYGIEILAPDELRITPRMRVKYGDRVFNIMSVLNPGELGLGTTLLMQAKEERGEMDAE